MLLDPLPPAEWDRPNASPAPFIPRGSRPPLAGWEHRHIWRSFRSASSHWLMGAGPRGADEGGLATPLWTPESGWAAAGGGGERGALLDPFAAAPPFAGEEGGAEGVRGRGAPINEPALGQGWKRAFRSHCIIPEASRGCIGVPGGRSVPVLKG